MAVEPVVVPRRPSVALDYFELTKPRIMILLLITMVGAMVWAADGLPPLWLVASALLGMGLCSGGASAINHALDRDLDAQMERTRERPVAAGRVAPRPAIVFGIVLVALGSIALHVLTTPRPAIVFGIVLVALGSIALYVLTTPLAAAFGLGGALFYVLIYTMVLKRRTPQNIVIGGAAGAMPPLVGWAAVTGSVAWAPVILFGVIFLWTPPHFWALALVKQDEYGSAGVPMLPNVRGVHATTVQIVAYTAILVAFSLVPVPLALVGATGEVLGPLYGVIALLLGLRFLQLAIRLHRRAGDLEVAREVFKYSLLYLAGIFFAMALDRVLLG